MKFSQMCLVGFVEDQPFGYISHVLKVRFTERDATRSEGWQPSRVVAYATCSK